LRRIIIELRHLTYSVVKSFIKEQFDLGTDNFNDLDLTFKENNIETDSVDTLSIEHIIKNLLTNYK